MPTTSTAARRVRLRPFIAACGLLLACSCGGGRSTPPSARQPDQPPAASVPAQVGTQAPAPACACDDVAVTLLAEPAAPIAWPDPRSDAARAAPLILAEDNLVSYGGNPPAAPVGVLAQPPGHLAWRLRIACRAAEGGPERCAGVRVGLIQNLVSTSDIERYSGGGSRITTLRTPEGRLARPPLLDGNERALPYYHPISTAIASQCGEELVVRFSDVPQGHTPILHRGQLLMSIDRQATFRLWLVSECPAGHRRTLRFYDWSIAFAYRFAPGPASGSIVTTSASGCAWEERRGDRPPDPLRTPEVDQPLANLAITLPGSTVESGF